MEDPGSVYNLSPSQQQQQQRPPDGALPAGGDSCEYDPVMASVYSPLLGVEERLEVETEENDLLLSKLGKIIADKYPDLSLSPGQPQAHLQHPEAWDSAFLYPDCQGKGQYQEELERSIATRIVNEGVVAGVNGVLPKEEEENVGVPSRAKTGSQAFDYIGASAVLETYGIAACPQLGPAERGCADDPHTPSLIGDGPVQTHESVRGTLDHYKLYNTVTIDPEFPVFNETLYGTLCSPLSSCDTVNINPESTTVPDKTSCGTLYCSSPCDTVNTDPKSPMLPEGTSRVPDTNARVSGIMKKRQRKKKKKAKGEDGEERKKRKYEEEPLEDAKEERKRKDAIRAKRCREKNRMEVEMLREELKKKERELEGRRIWEKTLLSQLEVTHGICVQPYGSQMEPLQPLSSNQIASG